MNWFLPIDSNNSHLCVHKPAGIYQDKVCVGEAPELEIQTLESYLSTTTTTNPATSTSEDQSENPLITTESTTTVSTNAYGTTVIPTTRPLPCENNDQILLNGTCTDITDEAVEEVCNEAEFDLVILMDGSGSMGQEKFEKGVNFLQDFTDQLHIGANNTQITLLQFASDVEMYGAAMENDIDKVHENLETMRNNYMKSQTFTNKAIYYAWLASQQFGRPNVRQIVITLTDGASTKGLKLKANGKDPFPENHQNVKQIHSPDLFHTYGMSSFIIGIGDELNNEELEQIASDPNEDYLINIKNYDAIDDVRLRIGAAVCQTSVEDVPENRNFKDSNDVNHIGRFLLDPNYEIDLVEDMKLEIMNEILSEFMSEEGGYPGKNSSVLSGDQKIHRLPRLPEDYSVAALPE